jgi:hypothetical protein
MAGSDSRSAPSPQPHEGTIVLSLVTGALLGAAGLTWWLLSEAERRHRTRRQLGQLRLSRLRIGGRGAEGEENERLHDRVQQLNQAIDEVRRQLEQLQTHS